jgi:hypothetical protein
MGSFNDVKKRLVESKDLPWVTMLWSALEREKFFKNFHAPKSHLNTVIDSKNAFVHGNPFRSNPEWVLTELLKPVRVYPRVPTGC